ncbi:MAG: RNA polymerase sigma factor [Actinomycetota bacterium]|nr:RNA polymerase sigma factor [Actinomycetota bacterium]
MSEFAIAEGLAADLDSSFEALVGELQDAVFTAALRWSGNRHAAEDIAQETFLRAYSALGRYPPGRVRELRLRPWLLAIALNVFRNELRGAGRRPVTRPLADHDLGIATDGRGAGAGSNAGVGDLASALVQALPDEQRVAVVLRHVIGLDYDEIAEILGRPSGTVKAQVSRALRRLRDELTTSERNDEMEVRR